MIAAHDRQRAIGCEGQLPWHLPDDLKRFKDLTLGKTLLMGRKTAQSLGRALPGRRNLVLTRSGQAPYSGMQAVTTIDEAMQLAEQELMVIGGGEIYALCLPHAHVLHLTEVDTTVQNADAHFPEFDRSSWREALRLTHAADARHEHAFAFVDWVRAE